MDNLYKNFDIPEGLTGKINDFRKIFNQDFLENHGFHVRTVKFDASLPLLKDSYTQYSINTVKGEFIVGRSDSNNQPLVTYLGNGKWDIPESTDEKQKEASSK